jgi:multidrug efflux pump subunit AcrB
MKGIPGASIEVAKEDGGPPTDPPVNIEISGDYYDEIAKVASGLLAYLDTNQVAGVENLKLDVDLNSPEIVINIDEKER